jgi:midasin
MVCCVVFTPSDSHQSHHDSHQSRQSHPHSHQSHHHLQVRLLANVTGHTLHEFVVTSGTDSTDLLGCFEQIDLTRQRKMLIRSATHLVQEMCGALLLQQSSSSSSPSSTQDMVALAQEIQTKRSYILTQLTSHLSDMSDEHGEEDAENSGFMDDFHAKDTNTSAFDQDQAIMFHALIDTLEMIQHKTNFQPSITSSTTPAQLRQQLQQLQSLSQHAETVIGTFEWIDGSLIKALEGGDWVLLDNVIFCNPMVLDRLNGLLEPNGVLLVNGCGLVNNQPRIIKPHPNFRLFLAMDAQFGEISRTMRNRCVEITLPFGLGCSSMAAMIEKKGGEMKVMKVEWSEKEMTT